jgi:hypothetical protein
MKARPQPPDKHSKKSLFTPSKLVEALRRVVHSETYSVRQSKGPGAAYSPRPKMCFETLEPRVLLSADLYPTGQDAALDPQGPDQSKSEIVQRLALPAEAAPTINLERAPSFDNALVSLAPVADVMAAWVDTAQSSPSNGQALEIQPTISWIGNSNGFWDDANNWEDQTTHAHRLPGASDDVLIDRGVANPVITVRSGTQTIHSLSSTEALTLAGGSLVLTADSTISGVLTLSSGTLSLGMGMTLDVSGSFAQSGGTLAGAGALTITGSATLSGGLQSGAGTTSLQSGGTISGANGTFVLDAGRVLQNLGTLTWTGGAIDLNGGPTGGAGRIDNATGAVFTAQSNNALVTTSFGDVNSVAGFPAFNNAGRFEKSVGTGTTTVGVAFNNSGTADVQTGTLAYNSNLTNNQGTLNVAPGARLSVAGSFTNAAEGTVRIGLANATSTGLMAITGTANLGGTFALYLTGGFIPASDAVFNLMTYANKTGAFSVLRGDSDGFRVDFGIDTSTDTKTLKVRNINVTTQTPGVDLTVDSLGLTADTVLQSGNTVTVQWNDVNTGTLATTGSWTDRLLVRNISTNEVLADLPVPYDAVANGAIAGGGSALRQTDFVLPQGNRGAGNLSFTVTTDAANAVVETRADGLGEANNSANLNLVSALAPYPDLIVTDIAPTPAAGWLPGDMVTVNWKTNNQGDGATSGSWMETLLVRNLTTGKTLVSVPVPYDEADAGNGPIPGGASRDRSYSLPDVQLYQVELEAAQLSS